MMSDKATQALNKENKATQTDPPHDKATQTYDYDDKRQRKVLGGSSKRLKKQTAEEGRSRSMYDPGLYDGAYDDDQKMMIGINTGRSCYDGWG